MTVSYASFRGQPYSVVLTPMSLRVHGCIVFDDDGYPTILINSRLNHEQQVSAERHELIHLFRGDAYSSAPIRAVEGAV